ncbi:MAG: ABC transporter ATP-binding protein [Candidatus Competibacterales bacterium]
MIKLDHLTKIFETRSGPVVAADHISMEVPEGEICVLLGPSGCGKTTTMKMINRLIMPSSGKIFIGDRDTDDYDPVELRRTIGYVIQQIGLFPNMTVAENIAVVPRLLGWDKNRIKRRAEELLAMVALDPGIFLHRYPKELSGGQQQRIGVARALAADPPVMLMDEPFGAIDPINREVIQDEFLKLQKKLKKTIMFVSHDIDEAVKMANKVAIFRAGKLEQYASPDDILAHPANAFIADFVGGDRTLKRLRLVTVARARHEARVTVTGGDPLEKAAALMENHGLEVVVVVDEQQKPRGFVHRDVAEHRRGTVEEHQEPLPTVVPLEADLRTAVSSMFAHDTLWLPCVDEQGTFAGIVTQHGITHLLGETYRGNPRAAA